MKRVNVKLFDSLGCTLLSTALFQSLKDEIPDIRITAYSRFPDLLSGLEEVDEVVDSATHSIEDYDIDLTNYLSRRPHNSEPFRHLTFHMIKHAEEQLFRGLSQGRLGTNYIPKINLRGNEIEQAEGIVKSASAGKPVIWLQTQTNSPNKGCPKEYWERLNTEKSAEYSFMNLSAGEYNPRLAIAITKFCYAGITLDTFLLHGSRAVNAKNVIVILGSSRPEVVTYPGQTVLYQNGRCKIQPCGMHGYGYGCRSQDERLFIGHEMTRCITDDYACLKAITPEMVMQRLDSFKL